MADTFPVVPRLPPVVRGCPGGRFGGIGSCRPAGTYERIRACRLLDPGAAGWVLAPTPISGSSTRMSGWRDVYPRRDG